MQLPSAIDQNSCHANRSTLAQAPALRQSTIMDKSMVLDHTTDLEMSVVLEKLPVVKDQGTTTPISEEHPSFLPPGHETASDHPIDLTQWIDSQNAAISVSSGSIDEESEVQLPVAESFKGSSNVGDEAPFHRKTYTLVPPPPRAHMSPRNPETALAIFRYKFTSLQKLKVQGTFTLKHHPAEWPNASNLRLSLENILTEDNAAAKLLLVIFWSVVLVAHDSRFWCSVREHAIELLFQFHGAPDRYLGLIENVHRANKGYLEGIIAGEDGKPETGKRYFLVKKSGGFEWQWNEFGDVCRRFVIGQLPVLKLELI
jgi:hypothetical protein